MLAYYLKNLCRRVLKSIKEYLSSKRNVRKLLIYCEFIVRCFAILSLLFVVDILHIYPIKIQEIIASQVSSMLSLMNVPHSHEYFHIFMKVDNSMYDLAIDRDCIGWKSCLLFFALVFAVPSIPLKKRILGILIFSPILYIVNIARLATTFYLGYIYGAKVLDVVHEYLWREGLAFFVFLSWILWLKYIVGETKISYKNTILYKIFKSKLKALD